MIRSSPPERFAILADGQLGVFSAKTATCLLRYRGEEVVAVIDRDHAGGDTRTVLGVPAAVPIVPSLAEALAFAPTALVIGISPPGGRLPPEWRATILAALAAGLDVISTLHEFLADDPEIAAAAARAGRRLVDLRRPPDVMPIAHARAVETRARRILTVGTDCNIGKMVTTVEIVREAQRRGIDARMLATGQTGMLIAGNGVAIDRVIGDFMAGVIEAEVLRHGDCDWLVIEGQGCLLHPAYSGVTAALLHGSLPDAMILCHYPARPQMRNQSVRVPPLAQWIPLYEAMLQPLYPRGRVVGIALNTYGMEEAAARAAVEAARRETGLPVTDVIRYGAAPLVDALVAALESPR